MIKIAGIRTGRECECYQHGDKSAKFFLTLEKKQGIEKGILKLIVEEKEILEHKETSGNIKTLYKTLFKGNFSQKLMLKNNNSLIF